MKAAGLPSKNIFNTRICALLNRSEFCSYRGGDSGCNYCVPDV